MDLRHLRYFVAVAEELSFTRAAQRLHIAQPPLSTQIRGLEEELGAPLFVRDKRRVFLTQAGHELLRRARAVLGAAEEAKTATRNAAAGRTGRVALGYTASSMFTERLPAVLRRFGASHPEIELVLHEMTSLEQLAALDARSLDVGILRKPEVAAPKGVTIEPCTSRRSSPPCRRIIRSLPSARFGSPISTPSRSSPTRGTPASVCTGRCYDFSPRRGRARAS